MTRLNEAFVRREYELCGIQVTRNIGRLWAGRSNLSLAVENGGSTGVRRMINDVPTPAVGPVQRSDTELSKACITRDRQLSSVSDRLRRIKRNIGDRYAVPPMLD